MTLFPLARLFARREPPARAGGTPALILAIILGCYLMIVIDASIVITALPSIHTDLEISPTALSWVQNAYTLSFGGLLLLGARAGDLLGRRRVFVAGILLFTLASALAGLAQSPAWLLAARAVQGVGAAIAAPSTLALLTVSFPQGDQRTRALAYYGGVAGAGVSVGLVLGGLLTSWISWRWGLFINVPIGIVLAWLAPRQLPETARETGSFDLAGAVTATLGMTGLVYGLVRAAEAGWDDPLALGSFAVAALLLAGFVLNERRVERPITPLRLFASRERSGAYLSRMLTVGAMYGMFFFLTQFLQGVEGMTALEAGCAFLPISLSIFAMVRVVPRLVPRLGEQRVLVGGLSLALLGLAWLSRIGVDSAYVTEVAPPMVLIGIGMGAAFTPLTSLGIAGVCDRDAGAASGLVNAAHQLGGTLGIGILITVVASASSGGASHSLAEGVPTAISAAAVLVALGLGVALAVIRPARAAATAAEAAAA